MLREPDPHVRMLDRALAGRYVLERRLGRGGTGVVFLARELRLDRPVAIKLLDPPKAGDPIARRRFLGEARTAAQLSHPNIVPIFSVDECADVVFFAMARVGGGTGSTGPWEVVGTADYMSPEQAGGLGVDARSDIYSLGVVGYYALSGRLPFEAPDCYAMLARHITEPPPPLASVAPGVPRRLAQVIDRCLLKEPSARFPSGVHLADAVRFAVSVPVGPPLAVRAFLVESRHLSVPTLLYGMILGLAIPLLVMQLVTAEELRPRLVAAGFIVWLLVLPTALMLARVRRLVAAGFDRDDLTDALSAELARHREELTFLYGEGASRVERMLRTLTYAGVAVAGLAVTVGLRAPHLAANSILLAVWGAGAGVALLAAVTARACMEHRTDLRRERRLRFWDGPLGRWLFRLSGRAAPRVTVLPPPAAGLPSSRTRTAPGAAPVRRSEERRVGKERRTRC